MDHVIQEACRLKMYTFRKDTDEFIANIKWVQCVVVKSTDGGIRCVVGI